MRKTRLIATGGFGNQLFIWSIAHEIASRGKTRVVIYFDDSSTGEFIRLGRLFELSEYCNHGIEVRVSSKLKKVLRLADKTNKENRPVGLAIKKILGLWEESEFGIVDDLSQIRILRGFFQDSELALRCIEAFTGEILSFFEKVSVDQFQPKVDYDFIHIRRGDYLNLTETWGVLSMDYFIRHYRAENSTIVSTDDENSVVQIKEKFPNACVLGPSMISEMQAFKLMLNASRVIASNSSFSWWGAILANRLKGSDVTLPNPWTLHKWPNLSLSPVPGTRESKSDFL